MEKKLLAMLVCIAMLFALAACSSESAGDASDPPAEDSSAPVEESPAEAAGELTTIGVSFMKTGAFMNKLFEGMQDACSEHNIKLIDYYAENDIETQVNQVDDLIQQEVDALIIMPADTTGITPALLAADEADIPVVSIDSECLRGDLTIAYVASDNYEAGALAADDFLARMPDGAKIVALTAPEIECCVQRYNGFFDKVKAAGDKYEIVAEQSTEALMDNALSVMENICQAYEFDCVFAVNDGSALGAIAALQSADIEGTLIYSVDGEQACMVYLPSGWATGNSAQDPYSMGYQAAEILIKHFNGESYEYENLLPVNFVTAENYSEFTGF